MAFVEHDSSLFDPSFFKTLMFLNSIFDLKFPEKKYCKLGQHVSLILIRTYVFALSEMTHYALIYMMTSLGSKCCEMIPVFYLSIGNTLLQSKHIRLKICLVKSH